MAQSHFMDLPVESVSRELASLQAEGGRLLLGLSGGADSVALFRILLSLGRNFTAVHCDFHLRGEESERDRQFVEDLCEKFEVDLDTVHFHASDYCRDNGLSLEDGCRRLRYDYFRKKREREGYARIVVAHNADDNAETFLLALMRGAGLRGLKGMTVDNGEVMRPLLSVSRGEIEKWLRNIGQDFIVDSSNLDSDFRRNFLRNEVLPLLSEKWPGARESIGRSMTALQGDFRLLEDLLRPLRESSSIRISMLMESPAPESMMYHFIRPLGGTRVQAAEMCRAASSGRPGACWILPEGRVIRWRESFEKLGKGVNPQLPEVMVEVLATTPDILDKVMQPDGNRTLWLGEDPEKFRLRRRRPGDRISPLGMKGSSLVSDIVKDGRLAPSEAECVAVMEHVASGEIVWIPGLKRSRHHLVDLSDPPQILYRLCLRE